MNNLSFPLFITWSITSKCNLRCKHCFRTEYECDELDEKKIDELTNLFIEQHVSNIMITGGEPLTSNKLFYIAKKLKGKIKLGIATNGVLLDANLIKKLKEHDINSFQISLDGASEKVNDYIRGKGTFSKITENIKLLIANKCSVTLAMTANSFNVKDLGMNAIPLANELGVNFLRIEYYIPINSDNGLKMLSPDQMMRLENVLLANSNNCSAKIVIPSFDEKAGCGAGIYNCVLNSDLTISPCDLLTHKYRTPKINSIDQFQKYWKDDETFKNWREKMKCVSCSNKYRCIALEENHE